MRGGCGGTRGATLGPMRALLLLLAAGVSCSEAPAPPAPPAATAPADGPQADPATSHLPPDAFVVVRFAPPERFDAIGTELPAVEELLGKRRTLGDAILDAVATTASVDRSKPIYWANGPDGPVTLVRAAPGVTAEQVDALGKGRGPARFRLLEDGWIRVSEEAAPAEGSEPLALLPGDVSVTIPVGRLVVQLRPKLDESLENISNLDRLAQESDMPVPPGVMKVLRLLAGKVLGAVSDVTDVHYALTWRAGTLESEGLIRTKDGSALRRWLEARGGAKPNDLMGMLPVRSFWMVESSGTAAALDSDVAAFLDEALGEGAGRSILLLLSPSYVLHEQLTGQAAGVIVVQGLMAMSMRSIHEVKPDAPIAEAIAAIDTTRINRLLAELEIPVEVKVDPDFAKSGETRIHRMSYVCSDPQMAMFALQMQTFFAVEGRYLLVVQSSLGENELRALILRVRAGERAEHPHTMAMERLMPDRQEGLSVNLGTLKPILAMFAMAAPEAAKVVNAIPDDLRFSTALAVRGGHIHIRGDWALKECLDFAATFREMLR